MKAFFSLECKKHLNIFCAVYIIELLFLIADKVSDKAIISSFHSIWLMISWIFIAIYAWQSLYKFFYLSRDTLAHLLPIQEQKVLLLKSLVFVMYFLVYFMESFIGKLLTIDSKLYESFPLFIGQTVLFKVVSIISFFILLNGILIICKNIHNKLISPVIMLVTYVTSTYGLSYWFINLIQKENSKLDWFIGIPQGNITTNQYINILPIGVLPDKPQYLDELFYYQSLLINIVILLIFSLVILISLKKSRFNFIEYKSSY